MTNWKNVTKNYTVKTAVKTEQGQWPTALVWVPAVPLPTPVSSNGHRKEGADRPCSGLCHARAGLLGLPGSWLVALWGVNQQVKNASLLLTLCPSGCNSVFQRTKSLERNEIQTPKTKRYETHPQKRNVVLEMPCSFFLSLLFYFVFYGTIP